MTERDDTLEEIASYIDDSKEAAQRMGKLPLVAALEVMSSEVRSRKGSAIASETPYRKVFEAVRDLTDPDNLLSCIPPGPERDALQAAFDEANR